MKLIALSQHFIFIAANSKVISFPVNCLNNSISCIDEETLVEYDFNQTNSSNIVSLAISDNEKYLLASFENKWICCWDRETKLVLGSKLCKKRITSLTYTEFSHNNANSVHILLFSDKFGDMFGIDLPYMTEESVICMGHTTSFITDTILCKDDNNQLLITSDRDEKIRVTNFPITYDVLSYCLGHTSCVTSMSKLSTELLVSAGWDHRLLIWEYKVGKCVGELELIQNSHDITTRDSDKDQQTTSPEPSGDKTIDNNDDLSEEANNYEESNAGSYPFKIIAIKSFQSYAGFGLIGVIFKGDSICRIYAIAQSQKSTDAFHNFEFIFVREISLLSVPSDVVYSGNSLIFVLAKPYFIQVFNLLHGQDFSSMQIVEYNCPIIPVIRDYCISHSKFS